MSLYAASYRSNHGLDRIHSVQAQLYRSLKPFPIVRLQLDSELQTPPSRTENNTLRSLAPCPHLAGKQKARSSWFDVRLSTSNLVIQHQTLPRIVVNPHTNAGGTHSWNATIRWKSHPEAPPEVNRPDINIELVHRLGEVRYGPKLYR